MSKESLDALTAMPAFHDEPCPLDLRNVEIGSNEDEQGLDQFIAMQDIGAVRLKDIPDSVHLISITPKCLEGRTFVMKAKSAGLDDN
ncbi:adenylate cyclase-like protein [Trypanosoma grayi]|uniref:adenylate cyclase-like protein n=1 Tax=Trypanosoma grayi TaxID=71804 RepID=UPI0004F43B17|nr:adenylate cyclase-like protein [Trypanosoma grayi]KEG11066.1 adenylate cyclase-like protein [Trypanosoma grayi]